jgi:galactose-1-phosphate uridylyltransferase
VSPDRFPVRAVPVPRKLSTIEERRQDQSCLFQRGDFRNKGHNPEKLSRVRVLTRMVSVARNLSTIEEQRQENKLFVSARRFQELKSQT